MLSILNKRVGLPVIKTKAAKRKKTLALARSKKIVNNMKRTAPGSVDEYIQSFPSDVRAMLTQIRQTIRKTAPKAEEVISYGIAGYKYHGVLIFFAGFSKHVSVYPAPRSSELFKKELANYKGGKGTVQFPLDKPLPFDLIKRIVRFRLKENEEKAATKQKSKK